MLREFLQTCGHTRHLRQVILLYLISLAMVDHRLSNDEWLLLRHIASNLGFSHSEFERMLNMNDNQQNFNDKPHGSKRDLQEAYAALGVKATDSDMVIKRAYRSLMSQYHPDKLSGQGVPKDMLNMATAKAQTIQVAYDLIKKRRRSSG